MELYVREELMKYNESMIPHGGLMKDSEKKVLVSHLKKNEDITGVRFFFGNGELSPFKKLACYDSNFKQTSDRMEMRRIKVLSGNVTVGKVDDSIYPRYTPNSEKRSECFVDSNQFTMTLAQDSVGVNHADKMRCRNDGSILYIHIPEYRILQVEQG